MRKRNENNEITRCKTRLVAKDFSQRLGIDYDETYSQVVDVITLRFLIGLAMYYEHASYGCSHNIFI